MSVYIKFMHGRHTPNEELEDWGFDGPVLGPFPYFHITYGDDVKLGDNAITVCGKIIDFPLWNDEGLIHFLGSYYGDVSIFSHDLVKDELLKRHVHTNKVFQCTIDKIPTLINDDEEWVKIYARHKLVGIIW